MFVFDAKIVLNYRYSRHFPLQRLAELRKVQKKIDIRATMLRVKSLAFWKPIDEWLDNVQLFVVDNVLLKSISLASNEDSSRH